MNVDVIPLSATMNKTRNLFSCIILILLLTSCGRVLDQPDASKFVDMESIAGEWVLRSTHRDGEVELGGARYLFEDGTLKVSPTDFRPSYYEIKLQNGDQYTELDIIANWGDGRPPEVAETLCKLDGDELIWCHNNGKRPIRFLDPDENMGTIIVLARPGPETDAE